MSATDDPTGQSWIDVQEGEFNRLVIDASHERPIVVDFWAPWCGPCKQLGPILERVIGEHAGALVLAKVDIDQCPNTASRFAVRSVPSVLGFRDGEQVTSFLGAQPESTVRRFVAELLPSESDRLVEEALEFSTSGHPNAAEERLQRALELAPRHGGAWLALARLHAEAGNLAAALDALEEIDPTQAERATADHLAAELRIQSGGSGRSGGEEAANSLPNLISRAEAAPSDIDLQIELGGALAAEARHEEAIECLLSAIGLDPSHREGAARKRFLDLLEVLGPEHPLTSESRRRLAGVLFR